MKGDVSRVSTSKNKLVGSTMILALVLTVVAAAVIGAFMRQTIQQMYLTRRVIETQKARMMAEAGLEYAEMMMKDMVFENALSLPYASQMQALVDAIPTPICPDPNFVYMTPTGGSAFQIIVDSDVLQERTITNGTACVGLVGDVQNYTVKVGAYSPSANVGYVLALRLQTVGVFLIRYAVFYEDDLEIWPGPDMYITGPVHANSDMYVGCNARLYFSNRVTCAGGIYAERKYSSSQVPNDLRIKDSSGTMQSMSQGGHWLDSDYVNWINDSLYVWGGNVLSEAHGIQGLRPPVEADSQTNLHDIINRPIPTNSPLYSKMTEDEKFANKASLFITVDASNHVQVTSRLRDGLGNITDYDVSTNFTQPILSQSGTYGGRPVYAKDTDYQYVKTTNGSIDVTETNFYDHRENKWMAPVDLYLDEFLSIIATSTAVAFNYSTNDYVGLMYVTRDIPANGGVPVVRLRNGLELDLPISVVSDMPLYIEGDFNAVNTKPCLTAGDAVTLLSGNWEDARSVESDKSTRIPRESTFNTVIMTGNTETPVNGSSSCYNGGVENVLRFLETWSGTFTHYRGSIIDLWHSQTATGQWNGSYYSAPKRDWGYDQMYKTNCPPGMTRVFGMEELEWYQGTWDMF